jgi:transposase InsO family protein
VSRSGYYAWRDRPASATAARRAALAEEISRIHVDVDGTYGYRRMTAELARRGKPACFEQVRSIMREKGLVACQPRPFRVTTDSEDAAHGLPDLVGRDFTAEVPGTKLVGDITYIKTWAGWLYLAVVIDCATKMVVGWSMATHMRTSLIIDAIDMAHQQHDIKPGCITHSDRGSQYLSDDYRQHVTDLGMRQSVGRTGICWDNAMAESFFAALKNELVYRTVFPTHRHARKAIAKYIEVFYNRKRIHSGIDYRTPQEAYNELTETQQAA